MSYTIIIIIFLLFRSARNGVASLLAIVFGLIWVYGTVGLAGMSINPQMSGVLSMIMGIGIDFGIQTVNRFRQEREENDAETSLKNTMSSTITPMLITTTAALIGFRAMSLETLRFWRIWEI